MYTNGGNNTCVRQLNRSTSPCTQMEETTLVLDNSTGAHLHVHKWRKQHLCETTQQEHISMYTNGGNNTCVRQLNRSTSPCTQMEETTLVLDNSTGAHLHVHKWRKQHLCETTQQEHISMYTNRGNNTCVRQLNRSTSPCTQMEETTLVLDNSTGAHLHVHK